MRSRWRRLGVLASAWVAPVLGSASAQELEPPPFGAEIEVRRVLTEVRVVSADGEPVLGLGPADFEVRIAGERVEVESVLWVPVRSDASADAREMEPLENPAAPPEGRLIVVLVQVDPAFHPSRTSGLLRMAPRAAQFVAGLGPGDRVAVLVFRSHLQLRADFSDDLEGVAELLTSTEVLEGRAPAPRASGPSLAARLSPDEARDAASMDRALELIGQALMPIPAPKSLVVYGYALGRLTAGPRITLDDGYRRAMRALTAGRTSVFVLDITDADWHSLELGLRTVSEDTGGIYLKTHLFPEVAMAKLVRVISSYYELSLVPPPGLGGEYSIEVDVKRPRVEVHVRQEHPAPWMW